MTADNEIIRYILALEPFSGSLWPLEEIALEEGKSVNLVAVTLTPPPRSYLCDVSLFIYIRTHLLSDKPRRRRPRPREM